MLHKVKILIQKDGSKKDLKTSGSLG